jgi:hypothetical protein
MNLITKLCISAISLSALGLTGCASVQEKHKSQQSYVDYRSFAKNIALQLNLEYVSDIKLPADTLVPDSATHQFAKDTTINALINKNPLTRSLPNNSFNAFLLIDTGNWLKRRFARDNHNWILYYLPDNGRMTAEQAAEAQANQLNQAIARFLKDKKDEFETIEVEKVQKLEGLKTYAFQAKFKGKFCSEKIYGEDRPCVLYFGIPYKEENLFQINVPNWIEPSEPPAWKNNSISVSFFKLNPVKQVSSHNEHFFYEALSPYLPDNVFFYVPAHTKSDANNPPLVLDNKKVHFFVKPQK